MDPVIWDLLGKINVIADPEIDALFPGVKRARVSITTTTGEKYTAQVDYAKGSPENPLTDEELVAKFRANASDVLNPEQMDRAIEATWRFEEIDNLSDYMALFIE